MSDDPKFDREQYERWRKTPYAKKVYIPEKKESNLGKYLIAGGVLAVGALVGRKLRKGKEIGKAAAAVVKETEKESKTIAKAIPETVAKPPAPEIEGAPNLIEHQYPGRTKFEQINEDLSKLDYPKGTLPPAKNTFEQINEDLSKLDYSGTTGPEIEDIYPALIRKDMEVTFKKRLGTAVKGSRSVPKSKTPIEAKVKTKVESKVSKPKGSTAKLAAAAKSITLKPSEITATTFKTSAPAAKAAPKIPTVEEIKPGVSAPKESSIEAEIRKLKAENERLKKSSAVVEIDEPAKVAPTSTNDLNSPVAKAYQRNARLEKRLALRKAMLEKKTASAAPAPKTLEDLATEFLNKRGVSETGQPLQELVHDPEFEAIRQASRGGLAEEDLTEWGYESEKRALEALRSVGGRKSSFVDLIVKGVLPKSKYDPAAVARESIKQAKGTKLNGN